MAKFVTSTTFDAIAASQAIFSAFVQNFGGEEADADLVGANGVTYDASFAVLGQTEAGAARLVLAGDFDLSGIPTGTVEYLAIVQGEDFLYYLSELESDIGTIVPLLLSPVEPGTLHPAFAYALSGDDEITLSDGADYFDASTGLDQVTYDGAREDFTVAEDEEGQLQVEAVADAEDVDTLDNVEKLAFTDGSLIFDLDSANADFAYRIYAAAYGRTPDEAGLRFWTGVLDQRGDGPPDADDKEFVASFFLTAGEFADVYGADPTNEEYIAGLYEHVLKREPDQAGYDFWLDVIEDGQGKDDLLIYFTDSDENVANVAPDVDNGLWVL